MTSKRALLVARVSTGKQKENYSSDTQIESMANYARANGFEEQITVVDVISGAVSIYERPGGRQIRAAIQAHTTDAVIFYTFDRASRDDDAIDFMILRRDLREAGIELHIVREGGRLGDDFVAGLLAYLGVSRAGQERKAIAERTTRGRNAKAKSGRVVGQGVPPYGYRFAPGELVVEDAEAAIVQLMFQWYTAGDENGQRLACQSIAVRLNGMGLPSPSKSKGYGHRAKTPGAWTESTVWTILRNETYCGIWRYGKHIGKNGRGGHRPTAETLPVGVPPIVNRSIWEAAQAQSKRNKHFAQRNNQQFYLLRMVVKCQCGRHMYGDRTVYRCKNSFSRLTHCDQGAVRAVPLEDWAWQFALDALTDNELFESAWRKAQQAELDALQPKQDELVGVEAQLAVYIAEADEIANGLKTAQGVVKARLDIQQNELNIRYEHLAGRRDELVAGLGKGRVYTDEALADAMQFRADVSSGLANPTPDDKRAYIEWLKVVVEIKNGEAVAKCLLPFTRRMAVADITVSRIKKGSVASASPVHSVLVGVPGAQPSPRPAAPAYPAAPGRAGLDWAIS